MKKIIFIIALLSVSQLSLAFTFVPAPAYIGRQPEPRAVVSASPARTALSVFFSALPLFFLGESDEEKISKNLTKVDELKTEIEKKKEEIDMALGKRLQEVKIGKLTERGYYSLIKKVEACDYRLEIGLARCDGLLEPTTTKYNSYNLYKCYNRKKGDWDECIGKIPVYGIPYNVPL